MKKIALIGPFPPPVHGMAKNLKLLADQLSAIRPVLQIDTSPMSLERNARYHFIKFKKLTLGLYLLITSLFRNKISCVYMPPDGGLGGYHSLLYVLACKIFKTPLYLHHRSFAYIKSKTFPMSLIVKLQGDNTTHIFLCHKMKKEFELQYGLLKKSIICSNAQYVTPIDSTALKSTSNEIILGHLSNLGFGKGLAQVFKVCLGLKETGIPFKLILAGPPENAEASAYVKKIIVELGTACEYLGKVDGIMKKTFYSSIDIFLFPSNYKNEAQPNVLFEAHAFGIPTIAAEIGCISEDVNICNGFVFKNQQEYVSDAISSITELHHKPEKLRNLKRTTLDSISRSSIDSKESYKHLQNLLLQDYF